MEFYKTSKKGRGKPPRVDSPSHTSIMFFSIPSALLLTLLPIFALVQGSPLATRDITRTGRATYFYPGLGACGTYSNDQSMIVAMNAPTFDSYPGAGSNPNTNPICGKTVTVNYQGKTVVVQVVDKCPSCGANDIDLSPAAFSVLADESVGVIQATWTLQE